MMTISFDPKVNQFEGMERGPTGHMMRKDVAAGAACFGQGRRDNETVENAILRFACPCGCGTIGALPLKHWDENGWTWDGDVLAPTCTPSIQMLSPCRWHGYLTKGVFKSVSE